MAIMEPLEKRNNFRRKNSLKFEVFSVKTRMNTFCNSRFISLRDKLLSDNVHPITRINIERLQICVHIIVNKNMQGLWNGGASGKTLLISARENSCPLMVYTIVSVWTEF